MILYVYIFYVTLINDDVPFRPFGSGFYCKLDLERKCDSFFFKIRLHCRTLYCQVRREDGVGVVGGSRRVDIWVRTGSRSH